MYNQFQANVPTDLQLLQNTEYCETFQHCLETS